MYSKPKILSTRLFEITNTVSGRAGIRIFYDPIIRNSHWVLIDKELLETKLGITNSHEKEEKKT